MRALAISCILIVITPHFADARVLTKTAKAGQATVMQVYITWKYDCSMDAGIVKVLVKPQHGKLIPRLGPHRVGVGRYTGSRQCEGTIGRGFHVYYRSTNRPLPAGSQI
jgi:hypothetical protein